MPDLTDDETVLRQWIGRSRKLTDRIDSRPAKLMSLLVDQERCFRTGDALPPLWHWLYFLESAKQSQLGRDGHLQLGDFLPPVSLPRRMWAGGSFVFSAPVRIGDTVARHSTIKNVAVKQGKSGKLCFVAVEHDYRVDGQTRFTEQHDIVYRDKPNPNAKPRTNKAPDCPHWSKTVQPDSVLLFRYSALTFNGHRIHYDREFCINQEKYPGLVVHGPLTATLLIGQALAQHKPESTPISYAYKAVSSLFDTACFTLNGINGDTHAELWASNDKGELAMSARLEFG